MFASKREKERERVSSNIDLKSNNGCCGLRALFLYFQVLCREGLLLLSPVRMGWDFRGNCGRERAFETRKQSFAEKVAAAKSCTHGMGIWWKLWERESLQSRVFAAMSCKHGMGFWWKLWEREHLKPVNKWKMNRRLASIYSNLTQRLPLAEIRSTDLVKSIKCQEVLRLEN
ncbi:hypothetical protein CEXT_453151 [Caerostris extrusa]|uniref:Uncharacterized protein n=1 Tax=Caerostris extrusa TaxID=172846 RepID=A0AAV4PK00_CAEEX|nr:hypothetical protein CEXT_453151 [Caerostris extrusa]